MPITKESSPDILPDLLVLTLQTTGGNPFEELVKICTPITQCVTKRYFLPDYEREDFLQEGRSVLVSAVKSWDHDKGMPFMQYYHMQLLNHLNMLIRSKHAQKRYVNMTTTSLDSLVEEAGVHVQGRASAATHPEDMLLLYEKLTAYRESLSALELKVFDLYTSGQSYEEISECLVLPVEKIQNAMYRCRVKFDRNTE